MPREALATTLRGFLPLIDYRFLLLQEGSCSHEGVLAATRGSCCEEERISVTATRGACGQEGAAMRVFLLPRGCACCHEGVLAATGKLERARPSPGRLSQRL
jgi:hypothetical protein